jgi:FkbM family methyltransferase
MANPIAFVLASTDHGPMIVNRLDYNEGFAGNFYGVGAQLMEKSAYDPREVATIKSLLELRRQYVGDGILAIDCGANIGVHTVEWSKLMRGWGSVIAIEAQERIFYALAGNLALQNCLNVRAIWAAVDAECGTLAIPEPDYTAPASFGSFELKQRLGNENIGQAIDYEKPTQTIQTITLDSLALSRVDLIKLDVEGMELEALAGAVETIKCSRPVLVIEAIKVDKAQLEQLLAELGYDFYPMGMNLLAVHKEDRVASHLSVEREAA